MGLKSGFRVGLNAGFERAIEIEQCDSNSLFEVPILGPGMRLLFVNSFFDVFKKTNKT